MHGYYQTAETRHTFLHHDSRYTSSVLCEDSRDTVYRWPVFDVGHLDLSV